jgi:hypothetical protein
MNDSYYERLRKEREELASQHGKEYFKGYDVRGGDVYTLRGKHDNSKRISEIDSKLKKYEEEQERIEKFKEAEKERKQREELEKELITYTVNGRTQTTFNPAEAAMYNAITRYFEMSKTKQLFAKLTFQYAKFEKLRRRTILAMEKNEQRKIANDLNRMFR